MRQKQNIGLTGGTQTRGLECPQLLSPQGLRGRRKGVSGGRVLFRGPLQRGRPVRVGDGVAPGL